MVRVVFRVHGLDGSLRADLSPGESALFGRAPDPSRLPAHLATTPPRVVAVPSELASANHVFVLAGEGEAWVLDLQSRNGIAARHEPGVLHLDLSPRPTVAPARAALPDRAVWTEAGGFATGVRDALSGWLTDAEVEVCVEPVGGGVNPPRRGCFRLATGEWLRVTPRGVTHALHHGDDLAAVARFIEQQNTLFHDERDHEPGFVLRSPTIRAAHQDVCEAARRGRGLLLLGPSGTGKERFARCYHQHSARADGPFIAINCGAIPQTLMESELFGHAKNAFTGAARDRPGLIEAADGGTLFLDEVADLPPPLQVALLRVLDGGVLRRVGEVRERQVDVQVVCATHRDLDAAIEAGTFREDLWYRLARYVVVLPPLRDRPEDVEALLHAQPYAGFASVWDALTPDARALVRAHPWPGNVRELMNFVGRLPDATGRPVEAAVCRAILSRRGAARVAPPASVPEPMAHGKSADWRAVEARVWEAWLRARPGPPETFHDLVRFVDEYLKPAFVAHHGEVPPDAASIEEVARGAVAKRLGVEWDTADKWLRRYFKTFSRDG